MAGPGLVWYASPMDKVRSAFLLLVAIQACHSVEEYCFALYDRLASARAISLAISADPATGFLIANLALILLGLTCWAIPMRRDLRTARALAWIWALLEFANGIGHVAFALNAGGYFPGVATAPFQILVASLLIVRLLAEKRRSSG